MFNTLFKNSTLPVFLSGGILGAVVVWRYKHYVNLSHSKAHELRTLYETLEEGKNLRIKMNQAEDDYYRMQQEYFSFFGMNPGRPDYYQYMCESEIPEIIALHNLMPYVRQELIRLEQVDNFEEAEVNEYLLTIATLRKAFDKAVEAAKKAVEENKNNKLDKETKKTYS